MEKFEVRRIPGSYWKVTVPSWAAAHGRTYHAFLWEFDEAMRFMKDRIKEAKRA